MEPIDLGTTRLADKLEGAVGVDIYDAARKAFNSYMGNDVTKAVPNAAPAVAAKCSVCNSKWLLWAGIAVAAFMLLKVA